MSHEQSAVANLQAGKKRQIKLETLTITHSFGEIFVLFTLTLNYRLTERVCVCGERRKKRERPRVDKNRINTTGHTKGF